MKKILLTILIFSAAALPAYAQGIPTCPAGEAPALDAAGVWVCVKNSGTPNPTGVVVTPSQTFTPTTQNPSSPTNPNAFCNAQNGKCTYTSLEPLPLPGGGVVDATTFPSYVSTAFKLLLAMGATIAVVMLVLGALTYMFSDIVPDKFKAKERIRGAMWGIVLLVSSYLILNTINPDLVTFKLDLGPFTVPTSGGTATKTGAQPSGVSYPPVSQSSLDPNFGSPISNIQLTGDIYGTGENKAPLQQFTNQCVNMKGAVKSSGGDGINSSTYSCYVAQYQI